MTTDLDLYVSRINGFLSAPGFRGAEIFDPAKREVAVHFDSYISAEAYKMVVIGGGQTARIENQHPTVVIVFVP